MMINKFVLQLAILSFLFASCNSSKKFTSNVKPSEVIDLQLFPPIANVELIEKRDRGKSNDSVARIAENLMVKAATKYSEAFRIKGTISVSDTLIRQALKNEMLFLIPNNRKFKKIKTLEILPIMDSLLEAKGKRFGLITVLSGFTRSEPNYTRQKVKGILILVGTGGQLYRRPIKAGFGIYTIIVDAQENNIAFCRYKYFDQKEPTNKAAVTKLLKDTFKDYFYEK